MAEYIVQGESLSAIAEQIRSIQGQTEGMTLDGMNTNLEVIKTDIDDAFTSIANKGGVVPSSKVSGNLSSAIDSISGSGVGVQRCEGTLTGSNERTVEVDCEFKPDAIYFTANQVYSTIPLQAGVFFTEGKSESAFSTLLCTDSNGNTNGMVHLRCTRSKYGFSLTTMLEQITSVTLNYTAIKYA